MSLDLDTLIAGIVNRDPQRTEADLQAQVRQLLVTAPLNLDEDALGKPSLEKQVGARRRIDVEIGSTVIELKKDLRLGNVRIDAVAQLQGYVESRQKEFGRRYVGVLTDGVEWICYHLRAGALAEVSTLELNPKRPDADALCVWLEGVLATTRDVKPTPEAIRRGLGSGSSGYALDRATVAALYASNSQAPEVRTKRLLWARLLETALGTQFTDSDDLFIEHTLLVNSAELIAHAVLGLDLESAAPELLLGGESFEEAQVHGVVERDFFDWVVDVPTGDAYVRALARRITRFDWSEVEHDVLKVLYESVIGTETRKRLGEYYTPDWLAQQVVETVVDDPLHQRVLDPSCGSGTFLFHAIRRYLDAAKAKGTKLRAMLEGVTSHVVGIDLHPVAVTFARVTCLLAIGRERLQSSQRGAVRVQVFLGDSMQWRKESESLLNAKELTIAADDKRELVPPTFRFPAELLDDAQRFDALIERLATLSSANRKAGPPYPAIKGALRTLGIPESADATVTASFHLMCRLHDEGRDHVWGYYLRNLARPEWLARDENRADVLVGNPPWLAYRFMPPAMQADFRALSEARHLWHGAKVATQQDLSTLFVVRCADRYLRDGGRFGFVLPSAVLDRGQYAGFRTGAFDAKGVGNLRFVFETPWDLRRIRPHFFPIAACVVFGRRGAKGASATALPNGETWTGRLPRTNAAWSEVASLLQRAGASEEVVETVEGSRYATHFRNGASIFPRVLYMVERKQAKALGLGQGRVAVRSVRSANEKKPWKDIPALDAVVESVFIRPVHLGETVLPYRLREALLAVIPRDGKGLLDGQTERLQGYDGLSKWVAKTEALWDKHRSSERLSLRERLDFQKGLSNQFPIQPTRIVYAKSGMHLAAARVDDLRAVIDHTLYWATATTPEEALYLCAILNAAVTTQRVRPLMSYGKDERHIDKYVWKLPIPLYDATVDEHRALAELGARAEEAVAALALSEDVHFATARRAVREALEASEVGQEIEARVAELLG